MKNLYKNETFQIILFGLIAGVMLSLGLYIGSIKII